MFDWSKVFFLYVALSLAIIVIPVVFLVHETMISKMRLQKHDEEFQRLEELENKCLRRQEIQEILDVSEESEIEISTAQQEAIELIPREEH